MASTILQWNLRGFYCQQEHLKILLYRHNPIVVCLQETNFSAEHVAHIRHYSAYHRNRLTALHASGGVAIYIKDNIPHKEITLTTSLEAVAVSIMLSMPISICNVYLPNSNDLDPLILQELIHQLPHPFLLLGDFNSHSTLWGCSNTNTRGKIIETLLFNNDLILLNSSSSTHFNVATGNFSSIDLSISTPTIAHKFTWSVYSTPQRSDHFPITITIDNATATYYYNPK